MLRHKQTREMVRIWKQGQGWHAACSSYGNRPTGKSPARADCGVRPQVGSNTLPQMSGSGVEVGETPVR